MIRPRHLPILLVGFLLIAEEPAVAGDYFLPGNEGAVVELLQPYSDEDLVLEGWSLTSLEVGPSCEVRLGFGEDARKVTAVLEPAYGGSGSFRFRWSSTRPSGLGDAFEALVRRNDPGDFFRGVCSTGVDPVEGEEDAGFPVDMFLVEAEEGGLSEGGGGHRLSVSLMLRLILVVVLAAFGLFVLGQGRTAKPTAPPGFRDEPWGIKAVFLAGLGVRILAMVFEPSHFLELEHLPAVTLRDQIGDLLALVPFFQPDGLTVTVKVFHTPTVQLLLAPWHLLGDTLGVGGSVLWMRLPNLALAGWLMVLLLRTGRHLERVAVGRVAMVLFAFLPQAVDICTHMGHYFPEAVLSAWLFERLLAATRQRREVWRWVALAAGAALWSGYVTWPLVGIGVLGGMIHLWRCERRKDAAALVLAVSALVMPLIGTALDAGTIYDAACVPLAELETLDRVVPVYEDHPIFGVSEASVAGVFLAPWRVGWYLFDPVTAALAMLGLLVLVFRGLAEARIPLLTLLIYGYARTQVTLTLDHLRLLVPMMLFLPAWGFDLLPDLRVPRLPVVTGRRVMIVFAIVALAAGAFTRLGDPHSGRPVPPMGFYRGLAAQIGGDSQWRVRKVLEEEGSQDIPLLSLWGSGLCQACCCYGFSTYDELSRCLPGQQEGYPDDVLAAGEGGREVLLLPRVGCDEVDRLLDTLAWQGDSFFVLLPEGLHPEGWPDCMAEWMRACEVVVETPQMRLWRCTRISR